MFDIQLRDYQLETIDALREAIKSGKRRPVVQAPTGAGKTVMAASVVRLARENNGRVIFCVPAISLIDQTVERFIQNGIPANEIGVIQADHELTNPKAQVQVASVQTLMRRQLRLFDIAIIDECHVTFEFYNKWFAMPEWQDIPIIGLTATPWAKGMGKIWDDLIVCTTTQKLIELGHLCDFRVFAPSHPDLRGVKTVAGDYELKGLGEAMDKQPLVADIVSTWIEKAEYRPTLCFCVNRLHAKHLQKEFEAAGIPTAYQDAFTDMTERTEIANKFALGQIKIVCNVGTLTTGIDWDVRCIILARPTKSEILYTQIIGRGLRTAAGKDHCLILDHSDTTLRLGFVTDIHHDKLHDGSKNTSTREKPTLLPKECPKCHYLRPPKTPKCPSCGFKAEAVNKVENAAGELLEITRGKKVAKPTFDTNFMETFYRELIQYARIQGYKDGWAFYAYQDKFHEKPQLFFRKDPLPLQPATASWIKHRNIAKAKSRAKYA